ncbi:sensor histidine kinase [Plantactinospora soyae]|uniref:histidine kinase n=1 Tax=Plantactinospora soyae TaxID=1544732 RepID=A0A927M610_9ACTN|nr:histidine kinase [Plantactinospora soyae]MBE1488374.1 signal transduction histidine kinase [Plantactinospora soyae]
MATCIDFSGMGPRQRRAVDLTLAAVCVLAGAWDGLQSGLFNGSPIVNHRAPLVVNLALGLLSGLAVLVRRDRPLLLYGSALLCWIVVGAWPGLLLAQFSVGAHLRRTWLRFPLTALMVAATAWPIWRSNGGDAGVPLSVALSILPVLVGLYLTSRREVLANLEERVRRNAREERLRIDQARAQERAQIARDMHDVVTHRVALMVLHATALESARGRDAVAIAGRIQGIGREALAELRTLVGVLRDGAAAPLRPQPGIGDLPELVDASRALGHTVELSVSAGLTAPALVQHAIYRVVQEALTNVHKHAYDARTSVVLKSDGDGLRLVVRDDGGTRAPGVAPGGGHGLLGIAERVRLVGGTLGTRRLDSGGFEVSARLPVTGPDLEVLS